MDVKQIFSLIKRWLWLLILGSVVGALFDIIQRVKSSTITPVIFSDSSSRILS